MKGKKWLSSILVIAMLAGLAACSSQAGTPSQSGGEQGGGEQGGGQEEHTYQVAVLIPGSINDGGWGTTGYEGAKQAAESIGAEFSYTETKSPQDAIEALTDYGERGFDIVFCHSYDYQDACSRVAPDYPNTQFITSGGTVMTENITPIYVQSEQAAYLLGVLAAKTTTTGKIGLVGSEELPSITKTMVGFEQGVTDTDATVEVTTTYLGTSTDVGKAREATVALINSGCDIIFGNANAAAQGVFQAVDENKDKGVLGFGSYGRITQTYPDCFLADMISDYTPVFIKMAGEIKDGTFVPGEQYFADIFNGGAVIYFNDQLPVSDEAQAAYDAAVEKFRNGEIEIDIGEY